MLTRSCPVRVLDRTGTYVGVHFLHGRLLSFAMRVWLQSPSAYRELAGDMLLPSERTLQRARNKLPQGPGWHAPIICDMV